MSIELIITKCPPDEYYYAGGSYEVCEEISGRSIAVCDRESDAMLIVSAFAALSELVLLKDGLKESAPEEYERRKPLAWEMARDVLGVTGPEAKVNPQ